MTNLNSDKPVKTKAEDKFQRYEFSKRVARAIVNRSSKDCLVVGIYGAWGEGKTSIINFIEQEIDSEKGVFIRFNPWRYSKEDKLLETFFHTLASAVGETLEDKSDKIKSLFKKYSKAAAPFAKVIIPGIGDIASTIIENAGDLIQDYNIEELKDKINEILGSSDKKIVIAIDDIDRLDKTEIYSVFRLVKLTADFLNTNYILSFDENMVAAAIGERFGEGNKKSGFNFLEKIVQVPLKIPIAQPEDLKDYCFKLTDKVIKDAGIELSEEEGGRFVNTFVGNILIRLNTPRLAVRYTNLLSFALPLLKDEVNHIDLLLIEAVKIFYPKHYEFIKHNSEFFIGGYQSSRFTGYDDNSAKKIKSIKEHIGQLGENLDKNEQNSILSLLKELFPRLKEAFDNYAGFPERTVKEWYRDKRIVSRRYFDRYFSYTILRNDIPDTLFNDLLQITEKTTIDEISDKMMNLITISSPSNFIYKLRMYEEVLKWDKSKKVILALSYISDNLPNKSSSIFSFWDSPMEQACFSIKTMLKNHVNLNDRFEVAKYLIEKSKSLEFAFLLDKWFRYKENNIGLTEEGLRELARILLERIIVKADGKPIFKVMRQSIYLLREWKLMNEESFLKYITNQLENNNDNVLFLLKSIMGKITSTGVKEPYFGDFRKENYEFFQALIDTNVIIQHLNKLFNDNLTAENVIFGCNRENNQTDVNIAKQFLYWEQLEE